MKNRFLTLLIIVLLSACAGENRFPQKQSHKIPLDELTLETKLSEVTDDPGNSSKGSNTFDNYLKMYENQDPVFNLDEFKVHWNKYNQNKSIKDMSRASLKDLAEASGLLLELTADPVYANQLESISKHRSKEIFETIAPYILTKSTDHIYVNLFYPASIHFNHTLGGEVKFRQETNYPESGNIRLHIGMTERRYMELYIRIPDWAEDTSVEVKQVKYFAPPGGYCKIAKKWKEGDMVEINLPIDKLLGKSAIKPVAASDAQKM